MDGNATYGDGDHATTGIALDANRQRDVNWSSDVDRSAAALTLHTSGRVEDVANAR